MIAEADSDQCHLQYSPAGRMEVMADRNKIGSVISNLLSNAIKYSPESKVVEITSFIKDGFATVAVHDRGMGIDSHDLEKLFERFYRVESNTMQHISGFGIGLYLCSEIIERHGGEIWATSELGKGSTFFFKLAINEVPQQ